ncbi:MAG: DUF4132 domain-containing protein [Kofleriaceae bacterium]
MATNPGLEAVIESDPDDDHSYFVYGDWLQTQSDPRGELIALQAAVLRDPANETLADEVTDWLARNDGMLLGELGGEMTVSWHLGFVRDVRLAADKDPDGPLAALRGILNHPSGRFVRSISFANPKAIEVSDVVDMLISMKKPMTLSELSIGGTFDIDTDAPELRKQFPRLARSLDTEWRGILKALAKQRAIDIKYDVARLPRLVPKGDVDIAGVTPEHILVALRSDIEKKKGLGIVGALKRSFTAESLDAFVVALGQFFIVAGAPTNMKWGFQAIGELGGDKSVEWIASHVGEWSHQRAIGGAELLAQIGSPNAIWELYAMAADPSMYQARRHGAQQDLANLARARKLEIDQLLDRSVPPAVRETKQRPAQKRSAALDPKSRLRDALLRHLQAQMVDGRRMPSHDFVHYVMRHPVVAPIAERLVWATYEGVDVETTFRIAGGKAIDAHGDEIDLDGAKIGILHPLELSDDDRRTVIAAWKKAKLAPPFPQLERPIELLHENEGGMDLGRFKLRTVGFGRLKAVELAFDWEPDQLDEDHGPITIGWTKRFPRDGVVANAKIGNGNIEDITLKRGQANWAWSKVHPVTASEILMAFEHVTSKKVAEVAPEQAGLEKGQRVRIGKGEHRNAEGRVFWIGDGSHGLRCGIKTDDDETLWANVADVKVIADDEEAPTAAAKPEPEPGPEPEAPPAIAKGSMVTWKKGKHSGTGVLFWTGKNKFGDGMRAGVKDDETKDTVWVDLDDCKPVT